MILIITNNFELINDIFLKKNTLIQLIFLNPWGFSKTGVENQVLDCLKDVELVKVEGIILSIDNLFFGRRGRIVLFKLNHLFPSLSIIEKTPQEVATQFSRSLEGREDSVSTTF